MRRLSWILTPHITTIAESLFGPPSSLMALADTANPLLGDFLDVAFLSGWKKMPQILMADHYQVADVVALAVQLSGIDDWLLQ